MSPTGLAAYQAARAEQTRARAHAAVAALVKERRAVTFSAVAERAGVSRGYLYRTPELAGKIRAERDRTPALAPAPTAVTPSVEAALREHIRRLEATHERELKALREENQRLRHQLQTALGELISRD